MHHIDKTNIKEFNKWSKIYDFPLNYLNFYLANKKLLKILKPKKGSSLLDVGFGTGILLEQLIKYDKNLNLYGLDISDDMVKAAQKKFADQQVKLILGSAIDMPFKDNSFDYVTCIHSFHHHPDSIQSLKEMKRVLKKGGEVAIMDNHLDGFWRQTFHNLERTLFPVREGNIRRYLKDEMKKLFDHVGFKNIRQYTYTYFSLITIGEK